MITNGARHCQASWPHSRWANRFAIHSAVTYLEASILTSVLLSLVVVQAVCIADLYTEGQHRSQQGGYQGGAGPVQGTAGGLKWSLNMTCGLEV